MRVVICCQKKFGFQVLYMCEKAGFEIAAVVCPLDDRYIIPHAQQKGYKVIQAGQLDEVNMPKGCHLGITAHSFDYINAKLRSMTRLGWLGYHPSLLPRHRGRSSIEWALRMKDFITGGTLYWLDKGMDEGDIAYQDWIWLDHEKTAKDIWNDQLAPLGLKLFTQAFVDLREGRVMRAPQSPLQKFATSEPGIEHNIVSV